MASLAANCGLDASLALILGAAAGGSAQPLSSATASRTDASTSAGASAPAAGGGRLIAQILADIGTYYLEPVSVRRVAVAGAARLGGLDNRLAVREEAGAARLR